jgi:hypothetical protein
MYSFRTIPTAHILKAPSLSKFIFEFLKNLRKTETVFLEYRNPNTDDYQQAMKELNIIKLLASCVT